MSWWSAIVKSAAGLAGRMGISGGTVYVAIAVFTLGSTVGFWVSQNLFLPDPIKVIEYISDVKSAREEVTDQIEATHTEREIEVRTAENIIPREAVKHAPQIESNPALCNIPIGSVRLLNDARAGRVRESSLPSPAGIPDEEGTAPSTLTRRDLIQSDAEIAIQYNLVVNQLNSLIEWVQAQQTALNQ